MTSLAQGLLSSLGGSRNASSIFINVNGINFKNYHKTVEMVLRSYSVWDQQPQSPKYSMNKAINLQNIGSDIQLMNNEADLILSIMKWYKGWSRTSISQVLLFALHCLSRTLEGGNK